MLRMADIVQSRTTHGDTVQTPFGTVTPEAKVIVVRLPFGGFAWQRPTAVRVVRNGTIERIEIPDPTRIAQVGLVVAATVFLILALGISRVRRNVDE